jgi:beta-glucosidase/6-phospho-beta-glucosidase/beta-galactosidase
MKNCDFEEWRAAYETELREGVQKRFGLVDVDCDKSRRSDESLPDKDQGTLPTS